MHNQPNLLVRRPIVPRYFLINGSKMIAIPKFDIASAILCVTKK